LSKARALNALALEPPSRAKLGELMKKTSENQQKLQTLADAVGANGKLDKETLDRSLDRMLKAADEINRELDELLAKARS